MDNPTSHLSEPGAGERPVWMRTLALSVIWLLVLQPAVSGAQLAQSPMFTVTSAPPNVMLMFDDSASMNRLDLNPPPAYNNPYTSGGGASSPPLVKLNTAGYFNISGIGWYCMVLGGYCDNRWQFSEAEVLMRSAAFNPLAYNPAIEYKPWSKDGARMPNSAIGGTGLVASGALTEWDPRLLPPSMEPGYPKVSSFTATPGPNSGVIEAGGVLRSWTGTTSGSVTYAGLPEGGAASYIIVTGGSPSGADLFTNTIVFDSPDCTPDPTTYNYPWFCPAGSGGSLGPATDTCDATTYGMPSTTGRCCNLDPGPPLPTFGVTAYKYGYFSEAPPGPPIPAMTPPADADSPTCLAIFPTGNTQAYSGMPCTPDVDPPPFLRACTAADPPGAEECFTDPPNIPGICTTYYNHQWGCQYTHTVYDYNYTCPVGTDTAQMCGRTPNPATCSGAGGTPALTGNARYVSGNWTPARYLVYDGPAARTSADIREMDNYRMIMVDRSFGWNGTTQVPSGSNLSNAVGKYYVVDAVTGLPAPAGIRTDCPAGQVDAFGQWCTFAQEAQNYANWFTYYRSRLFAAVGVVAEVATGLTGPEQFMRMGYGRINYFPNMRNNWNVASFSDRNPGTLPDIEGVIPNVGGVERGVRPFTVYDPPLSATPNPARKNVFDWLFTINGLGPTPNREALHGAGMYFTSTDSKGPWGAFPGSGSEPASAHLWCRRNYTLLATDGEWTRLASSQPRLDSPPLVSTRSPLSGGSHTVEKSMSVDGPLINDGVDRDTGLPLPPYQYVRTSELAIYGGSGTQTETLTDVLHYYWTQDMRPDLQDSLKPTTRNRAFWQHMSAFIVGYGVIASMDDPLRVPPLRTDFDTQTSITWPTVGLEDCRQLDDNDDDTAVTGGTCAHVPPVSPGSGNRINDTMRGALTSGGDFFAATSPAALKSSLQSVFQAIGSDNASGTSPGLSSSTVGAGNLIIQSGFFTNTWDGYVKAFDQQLLLAELSCTVAPCTAAPVLWTANFDTPATRPIFTSTAITSAVPFKWVGGIDTTQQTLIGSSAVLDYLRGDQTQEIRFPGGVYRNRITSILGDVVASTPVYSKATDHAYTRTPAASRVVPFTNLAIQGSTKYPAYLTFKRGTGSPARVPIAMFGANDGMFHVLDARVGVPTKGKEMFAYVPRSLYSTLNQLASPAYSHRFYVDGPVIEGDIFDGTNWKTIAIGTTGAGAAGIFAIDVTDPVNTATGVTNMGAGNLKWDIVPSDASNDPVVQSDLGNVLQPGIIGSVKDLALPNTGRWVYMVGNGYESVSQTATLFVFDAFDGSLVKALRTGVGPLANPFGPVGPNGLGGITPVYDGNRNIIAVYGGDKLGNMWKFDFSSGYMDDPDAGGPKTGWEIFNRVGTPPGTPAPLFTAHDGVPPAVGAPQPITAAPRITPHGISGVHVGFGTGKLFEPGDQISLQQQAIYVVWDKGQVPTIPKASMQRIRMANVTFAGQTFRELNGGDLTAYDWTTEGFYIPLNAGGAADGERILAPGVLDAGVLSFTSFAQQSAGTDLCTPGGTSHVYRLNLIGGLAEAGFLGVTGAVVGKRIQPGLVSTAPPIYEPVALTPGTIHDMDAKAVKDMLKDPKYRSISGRAVQQGATGTCAHVGLKVDGTVARIPTACAGLIPLRTWRPVR